MTNYAEQAMDALRHELPTLDPDLLPLYTLLVLTKGAATTKEDVRDAWALWMARRRPDHKSLIPFDELTPAVQELDSRYVDAIHRAAARLADTTPAHLNLPPLT